MSRHTHVILRAPVLSFDTALDAVVDGKWVPIEANVDKVIRYFVADLPQEVQQLFIQQFTVFLEHICEAGEEANLIREYFGDYLTWGSDSADLPKALSALTGKALSVEKSLEQIPAWTTAVASTLNRPYITKLVVAALLSGKEFPQDKEQYRRLFLSLL